MRVYEVNVSSQTEAAVQAQAGLRQVLVRATGARDAANDPALAGVLAQCAAIRDRDAARGHGQRAPRWFSMLRRWNATSPRRDAASGRASVRCC